MVAYKGSTNPRPLPNTATMIQQFLGKEASGVPCMDVNLSCLSWLAAFEMAAALLQTGRFRRIAIVSAEQPSLILNAKNVETHALFGDAAVAIIVEKPTAGGSQGILKSQFKTYSDGWNLSLIKGGGLVHHPNHEALAADDFSFQMQNRQLLLYSFKRIIAFFNEFIDETINWNDIQKVVPHQASRAGLGAGLLRGKSH